jgi:hypothetical protein
MYAKALSYFMKYLGLNINDYDKLLDKDVKLIQMNICDFITHLKVDHSAACVSAYVVAISKFYTMNDVTTLNWKKITSFMGKHEKIAEDRPYTHSEIQTSKISKDRSAFRSLLPFCYFPRHVYISSKLFHISSIPPYNLLLFTNKRLQLITLPYPALSFSIHI